MKESYRERNSEPLWPRAMQRGPEAALEALDWVYAEWVLCANASTTRPCGVEDLCMETPRARTERPDGRPHPQGSGPVGEGDELYDPHGRSELKEGHEVCVGDFNGDRATTSSPVIGRKEKISSPA